MKLFNRIFLVMFLIVSAHYCTGQKGKVAGNTRQKITVIEKSYKCQSCKIVKPEFTIAAANEQLKNEIELLAGIKKISGHFTHNGDHFILQCNSCEGRKTWGYIFENDKSNIPSENGFGTYVYGSGTGKTKGDEEFYKFSDLLSFLQDSILIFDSVQLSVASVIDKDPAVLNTFRAGFVYKGKMRERSIPYDNTAQSFTISYKTLFGDKLSRDITDSIEVGLLYYTSGSERTEIPGLFKVYFASDREKKSISDMVAMYKIVFPDWSIEQIAEELIPVITGKYKNVSNKNFINWLKSLP